MDIHVEADITLLTPEEGGRRVGIFQRYRPLVIFDQRQHHAEFVFKDAKPKPGQTVSLYINFLNPERLAGRLQVGHRIGIQEKSGQLVGTGIVTQLLKLREIAPEAHPIQESP